mgnify:CR=1 FL=1
MEKHKPLILISNDDGYSAKGINELAKTLAGLGEIVIMAPDGPRSGASAAITSEFPVRYYKVKEEDMISIVCATNNKKILEEQLEKSLKKQSYKDYELIIYKCFCNFIIKKTD